MYWECCARSAGSKVRTLSLNDFPAGGGARDDAVGGMRFAFCGGAIERCVVIGEEEDDDNGGGST